MVAFANKGVNESCSKLHGCTRKPHKHAVKSARIGKFGFVDHLSGKGESVNDVTRRIRWYLFNFLICICTIALKELIALGRDSVAIIKVLV
jgi:hypothetical protein